jgi:hypothetical protein
MEEKKKESKRHICILKAWVRLNKFLLLFMFCFFQVGNGKTKLIFSGFEQNRAKTNFDSFSGTNTDFSFLSQNTQNGKS